MVEGFSTFPEVLYGVNSNDYGDMACGKTFLHTLCPTVCFYITHNSLFFILHPTVCVWMDKLDFMVEIFFIFMLLRFLMFMTSLMYLWLKLPFSFSFNIMLQKASFCSPNTSTFWSQRTLTKCSVDCSLLDHTSPPLLRGRACTQSRGSYRFWSEEVMTESTRGLYEF